jgi:signal transduction histidine kinase
MSDRPWSMRRRIFTSSLVWTLLLMSLIFVASSLLGHQRVRITSTAHTAFVLVLFALGALAGLAHIRLSLGPFERLRERLLRVREGREPKVTGDYPAEIQTLVNDLNALLDQRDQAIRRAQTKAGDLAHGLKTPLAVIAQEAARAEKGGDHEFAAVIRQEVDRLTRQVDYHLAQARAAAAGATLGASARVAESAEALARTLRRLYAERGLTIDVTVSPDALVRVQREDLEEMLGNLLDNACKWARTRVAVSVVRDGAKLGVIVDDDGPGIAPSMRAAVLQRGVRADEAAPGTGMGLAIVCDLAELYGGAIALSGSPIGGLRATLTLP